MKKQKILLILIAIFVLMSGVVFGLWKKEKVQQKKDQAIDEILKKAEEEKTFVVEKVPENQEEKQKEPKEFILPDMNQENWETYTDDVWGFSIKFPKEFYYRVHPQGETYPGEECVACGNGGQLLIISDREKMGVPAISEDETIHIIISTIKNKTSIKELLEKRNEDNLIYSDIIIGDNEGLMITDKKKLFISQRILNREYLYIVYSEINEDKNKENVYNLIKEIFSTFKFIK